MERGRVGGGAGRVRGSRNFALAEGLVDALTNFRDP